MNSIDNSENITGSLPDYPCAYCGRKNCSMSISNNGKCQFFISESVYENMSEATYNHKHKIKNYIKKNHHKKKSYHRYKF